MSDCLTPQHLHDHIKEFKLLKSPNATSKQKAFALIYTRYIQFPEENLVTKKYANGSFFNDIVNCSFDSEKVIYHPHMTRGLWILIEMDFNGFQWILIENYIHSFCDKKIREMTDKIGKVRGLQKIMVSIFLVSCTMVLDST